MPLEVGDIIDRKYRVTRLIGKGGMGSVYEGEHMLVERRVAIKVLEPALEQERAIARFEQEARAAGRIGNEHILDVYDIGSLPDGARYLVMEYLDGETLRARIHRLGRITEQQAVALVVELLDGLGAAHRAGIVHRDLKPDNVFLVRQKTGRSDFVKLIDFGVSRFESAGDSDRMRMTVTGAVVGTPHYLSPEQARGRRDADARSDLFAVGVMLYEMVTGEVPFKAESFNDLLFQIVLEVPTPPEKIVPDLDPAFARIITKALAKDPADRFQSADDLAETLRRWAAVNGAALPHGSRSTPANGAGHPSAPVPAASDPQAPTRPDGGREVRATSGIEPVPTPSAFGTSQLGTASRRGMARGWRRPSVLAAVAVVIVLIALGVGVSLVRRTEARVEQSAAEPSGFVARPGESGASLVLPASAALPSSSPSTAGSAGDGVAVAEPAKPRSAALPPLRPALPRTTSGPRGTVSATPSASPPKRRRDFGY
jgi:eukaryotic-like serine/threonine-protein kinase